MVFPQKHMFAYSRRRSHLEQYFDILYAIKKGEHKPTRIMYKTTLSWVILIQRLKPLVSQGFLHYATDEKGHRIYELTEKGADFLENLSKVIRWEKQGIQILETPE